EMVVHKVLKETDPENVEKFKLHYFGFVSAEQLNDGKDKNYPCADITDDNYQCLRPINPQHDNIMNSEDLNFIQDADSDVLALNSATIQLVAGEGDYADPFYMPGDDVTTPHNEAVGVINKKENDEAIFVTVEPGKVFVGAAGMETMNINPYGIPGVDDIEDGDGAEGTNPHHDDMIHKKVALAKVINNRFFPLYVGEQFVIEPVLGQWAEADKVTYALAPRFNGESNSNDLTTLPDGIQLDPKTGMLYGSPTKPLDRTFITIKATYTDTKKDSEGNTLTYSSYYTFEIRVYNVMEVVLDLDSSDALKNVTSYYFHKEGAGNTLRKCRITEDQIESDVHPQRIKDRHTNFRNIMCYLEGEEHDINSLGYKLNIAIGPGLCNYYGYFPFYDLQWKPQQTNSTPYFIKVNSYGDNEVCTPNVAGVSVHGQYCYPEPTAANRVPEGYYFNAGKIPEYKGGAEPCWIRKAGLDSLPPVQCHGNYASYHDIALLGVTGPSCDSGSYKYKEITVSEVELEGGGKACTMGSDPYSTVSCAGNYQNCYNTSLLPGGDSSEFVTGEIIAAARGNIGSSGSSSSGGSSSSSGSGGKTLVEAKNTKIVYDRMRRRANFVGSNSCVHVGGQYTYDSPIRPNHFMYFREGWRKYFNDECTEGGGDNTCLTDPLRYGNPFNTLQCLNAAYEVMANIDVVVREWDRHFTPDYHLDYLDPDVKEAKAVLHLEPDDQTYLDPEFSDNVNHWASLKNNDWRLYNSHNNDVWSQPFNDYLTWDNTIYDDNLIPAGLFQEADKTPLYESCNYKILREEDGSIKRDANGDIKEETVTSPQVFPVQLDKRNLGYCSTGFCTGYAGDKCEALSDDVTINEYTCRLYTALGVEDAGDVNGYFTFRGWSAPQVPGEARSYYDFMACRDGKPNDKGDGELEACPGAGFTRPNNYPELP
ncbi:MAG: hypothetical protein J6Y94_08640, partial [Bacteriovoracaceae bacterium]|nr:hypothetical protein [Bacteriovoracaceae bacterium]